MLARSLFSVLLIAVCFHAQATRDSTGWDFKLKGIDFKAGGSAVNLHPAQAIHILESATPQDQRSLYNYDNAQVIWSTIHCNPVRVNIAAVMSNDHVNHSHFLKGAEFRFGLGFEIAHEGGVGWRFRNIRHGRYNAASDAYLSCAYQCQYLEIGYQVTSRPFLKRLALFMGLNGAFGMNTYKQVSVTYSGFIDGADNSIFNAGFCSGYANLGLKYNMSCDLNFFAQAELGCNGYGKTVGGVATFIGGAVGMRYKIIDEQDRPNYDLMKYW